MKDKNSKLYKISVAIGSVALTAIIGYLFVRAGTLEPAAPPADTTKTLDDIYCAMTIDSTSTSYGTDSPASPAATMHTLQEIYDLALRFPLPDTGATTSYGTAADDADYTSTSSFACDMSFTDNSDETITDNCTGLMWDKCSQGLSGSTCLTGSASTALWEAAKASCEDSTSSDYSDWRLPNVKELQSIVDYGRYNTSIDTTFFPATVAAAYWTSTTIISGGADSGYAHRISFLDGSIDPNNKTGNNNYIRCVRGR